MKLKIALPYFFLLVAIFAVYLPTLRMGFLTDDFLDCNHTFDNVFNAFSSQYGGGYRPLMILSWALDNEVWGIQRQFGWHLSNLLLLFSSSILFFFFLKQFLHKPIAIFSGTVLASFAFPMAVAVSKVAWRTTILALLPFIASLIIVSLWSKKSDKKFLLYLAGFLYLLSLLLKETAIAAFPVISMTAFVTSPDEKKWHNSLLVTVVALIPLIIYGLLRYNAMGFEVNYSESSSFGFFMLKNLMVQSASIWHPWLSGLSARMLLLLYPVAIYVVVPKWKNRIFLFTLGFFLILPVSNLAARVDLSVAALPGAVLFLGFVIQKINVRSFLYPVIFVFLIGILLFSRDEIKTLGMASDYVNETTMRIAEIAEEIPGDSPLFIEGIEFTVGEYGTFWPGEYMTPMKCLGFESRRFVTGTDRIWEHLLACESGNIVFLEKDNFSYTSFVVSLDMYPDLPDTTIILAGNTLTEAFIHYPSCLTTSSHDTLYLVPSFGLDSPVKLVPQKLDNSFVYNLASIPAWLVSDGTALIYSVNPIELTFCNVNYAEESSRLQLLNREF